MGIALGAIVAAAGAFLALRGIGGIMLPLTGVFIAVNAATERQAAVVSRRLSGLCVGHLTWFGIARAPMWTSTETMLWERSRLGSAGLVAVTDSLGLLAGVVTEERMLKVPDHRRNSTNLAELMIPVEHLARAIPEESLVHALGRLNPLAPVLTVWQSNRLVGVVPSERIRRWVSNP
jgi:hypothetical protein